MKLHKVFALLALAGVLVFASACDGLTDLNEDPNNPGDVQEALLLAAVESNFSYEVIANTPARISSQWIQQLASSANPPTESNYQVSENDVNNLWEFFAYTDVLKNTRILAEKATASENYHFAGMAKVIEAWTLSILTDAWGAIPYSEAFNVDDTTPAYDTQEEVYNAIFALLEEAKADLAKDNLTLDPNCQSDLVYCGDADQWLKLAHALEARFHMRLSRAPNNSLTDRSQQALEALQNAFTSNLDEPLFQYYDEVGAENPWNQWTINTRWSVNYQLAEHYVELLKDLDDPRLPIQARPVGAVTTSGPVPGFSDDTPEYVGQPSGEAGLGASNVSSIGEFYSDPDAPLTWFGYASQKFVEAEAVLYLQGAAAAQPVYEDAIRAHMEKLGVDEDDIELYILSLPSLTSPSVNPLEQIMVQKYIANFLDFEAYNDWRRNGYPVLEPVTNQARLDIIPLRFPHPGSEVVRNAEMLSATGVPNGYPGMRVPVWWDTTPGPVPAP